KLGGLQPAEVLTQATRDPESFRVVDKDAVPGATNNIPTYFWPVGGKIKIGFVSGDNATREFVKRTAAEWLKYANVQFSYATEPRGYDVRIKISPADGPSYSYLGKACREAPENTPT